MDPLDSLTQEKMITFLHRCKTKISCIKEPYAFLHQLRVHNLVPEDLYKIVVRTTNMEKRQKGVYKILDWLEKNKGEHIKLFWTCVFKDHIQEKYPNLRSLQQRLLNGAFRICEKLPNSKNASRYKEGGKQEKWHEQKQCTTKRKNSCKDTDEQEPGPSSVSNHKKAKQITSAPQERKEELHITCGDKKGILYPDKLAKVEECIQSEGHWFTPPEFERYSGREQSKNWKQSIRWQNITLQKLIETGRLTCPRKYRSYGHKKNKPSSIREESPSPEEEEFQASVLPVNCGSVSGNLYTYRFKGSHTKSICIEGRWFTPKEFLQQEFTLTDGDWTKDILCHGKTLDYLVKKNILHIHAMECSCPQCNPDLDRNNDDVCYICNAETNLVCCDECPRAFHYNCHLPTLQKDLLGDKWMCTFCVLKTNQKMWVHMSREDALHSPVSTDIMRCQYLLLCLYKEDTDGVFTDDPTKTVEEYSRVISEPMWLNKVKFKLQENKYRLVNDFVHDIKLIFNNWEKCNRDKTEARMGTKMNKFFKKEFYTVFKIQ